MAMRVQRLVVAPIGGSHHRIVDDQGSIIYFALTVLAHYDWELNAFPMRRDPAQRKQVMAVEGGVRELYPHPSLPHVRLGLLPEPQRGAWIVAVRAQGIDCKHHHISWPQTVGTVPPPMTYSAPVMEPAWGSVSRARMAWPISGGSRPCR